jgi:hypothetical protein
MTHNQKPCAALFLESEYDDLTLEAYSQSRVTAERLKNGRFPFSCIYCKVIHKNKNMISYHRMFSLCKMYKGHASLKMYHTWEKSDHGELNRIAKKYGKDFHQTILPKFPTSSKRKLDVEIQVPILKCRNMAAIVAPKTHVEPLCKISRSQVSPLPSSEKNQDTKDTQETSDDSEEVQACSEDHSDSPSRKEDSDDDTPPVPAATVVDIPTSSPGTSSEGGDFKVVRHSPPKQALTREDVEERAWAKAKLKFPDGDSSCVPPPPTPVDQSELYILIAEVEVDWMPKDLIEDPDACINLLYKMVEEGTLGVKLGSAFGQWYLYGNKVRPSHVTPRPSHKTPRPSYEPLVLHSYKMSFTCLQRMTSTICIVAEKEQP